MTDPNLSSFIWSVADLLRGDYKQSEYGKVLLPFTVLRRLDCVLEATKPAVLTELEKRQAAGQPCERGCLCQSIAEFCGGDVLAVAGVGAWGPGFLGTARMRLVFGEVDPGGERLQEPGQRGGGESPEDGPVLLTFCFFAGRADFRTVTQ